MISKLRHGWGVEKVIIRNGLGFLLKLGKVVREFALQIKNVHHLTTVLTEKMKITNYLHVTLEDFRNQVLKHQNTV